MPIPNANLRRDYDADFEESVRSEPVVIARLTADESRSLLLLLEVAAETIRKRRDTGHYTHDCQKQAAERVLAHADTIHRGVSGVLARQRGRA